MNRLVVLSGVAFLPLFLTPVFAQDQQVYEDDVIRVVARKVDRIGSTDFNVYAWVVGDKPIGVVSVDLVFKDFFDKVMAISELLLLWDEGAQALYGARPPPVQASSFWKWEIRNIIGLECRERKLAVIHPTDPSVEISARKLEGIRQDIERLKTASRISLGLLERIKGCW